MLILRYLTFANIGRLTIERMQLLNNMAKHSQQLQMVEAWADRLKQNIKEEHRTYLESVVAGYLGVSPLLVLCCSVLCCFVLCCAVLCNAVLQHAILKQYVLYLSCKCCALVCLMQCLQCAECKVDHVCLVQIGTAQQAAIGMTASYPGLLNRNALEEYAISKGEPSIPEIINQGNPCRHSFTWEHVSLYVQRLTTHNMFTHVPLQSMADAHSG